MIEYILSTIIKKKSDVSMWDSFKTSRLRVSIVDALIHNGKSTKRKLNGLKFMLVLQGQNIRC